MSSATYIDSHAHLDLPEFNRDRDEVIERARSENVSAIITIGIGLKECRRALQIAEKQPGVYAALGIHPHNAESFDLKAADFLEENLGRPKVVAVGEIGLDYYRMRSPKEKQIRAFRAQLDIARSAGLPVIIHDRDAHQDTLSILREENQNSTGGVLHCFSGDTRMARECIDMGYYISIPGTVTFKNAHAVRDVAEKIPLEHMLIETDCPFLTPAPFRGKRNEPSYVRFVAEEIARIKHISPESVAVAATRNTISLFSLPGA